MAKLGAGERTGATGNVGMIGLGVMGANLARNLARQGHRVVGYDRDGERAPALAAAHPEAGIGAATSLEDFVGRLGRPRCLILLVPAGSPVDDVLDALDPLLEDGDVVIDGGNSHFVDSDRRAERAASRPWHFVGMGISGGEEGALRGPSMMPGGPPEAWPGLRPLLESIAAKCDTGPCVTWCGRGSAGHFVKMVHNGIEYAEMQHLSEATMVLRRGLGHSVEEIADLFDLWNAGELESFLVEITAKILRTPDPQRPGEPLLDAVLDRAGQKGTGRWTVQAALDLNVATPSIAAAVDARVLSSQLDLRVRAGKVFDGAGRAALEGVAPDDVRAALFASRIAAYSQGFALLAAASRELDYGTDLAEIARIWKAGCIIRARLLEDARRILAGGGDALLALEPDFRTALQERLPAWRNVLGAAARAGLPVPGLSSSLGWFETLTTERGSASLIQAQRDYFGAHRYERVDAPGKLVHTDWEELLGKRD